MYQVARMNGCTVEARALHVAFERSKSNRKLAFSDGTARPPRSVMSSRFRAVRSSVPRTSVLRRTGLSRTADRSRSVWISRWAP